MRGSFMRTHSILLWYLSVSSVVGDEDGDLQIKGTIKACLLYKVCSILLLY